MTLSVGAALFSHIATTISCLVNHCPDLPLLRSLTLIRQMKSFGRLGVAQSCNHPSPSPEAPVVSEATPAPTPQAETLNEQGLHKRQISEAIPREERENERTEGSQATQETPQQVQATCKSQHARKPK
jgi:hypothetical protein